MGERRPNRKLVKHYHTPGDFHEFTFSCYRRIPMLTNDAWCEYLSRSIDVACQAVCFDLVAFVYMPEHLHLLTYPRQDKPDIAAFLARVKRPFSAQVKQILVENQSPLLKRLTIRERPGKTCFRFWQEGGGYDRNIFSANVLEASLDYIHNNPVKRGLCERAVDWKWSSARYYHLQPPRQQFPELPFIHGIPMGAFDRSD